MTTAPAERRKETLRDILRDSYLTFDRRTLGLTRICLGFYLLMDLFRRTPDWLAMFSDDGVLPVRTMLAHPQADNFSLLFAFQRAPELWALWALIFVTYVLLLVGYKTKIWQVLALVFVTGMNGRVLLIENGGYVVQNLVLLWTAFLPLGDRFSIDSMQRSLRRRRETSLDALADRAPMDDPIRTAPFVSLVGAAICLQFGAIYYFNVVHKTGPAWHDGTAVHFVLYNDRMATPIVAAVRQHIPFWAIKIMTPLVLTVEASLSYLVLLPGVVYRGFDSRVWTRRLAVTLICFLHIGFGSSFVLGPFAWALCVFSTVLFTKQDWETASRTMRRERRARDVMLDVGNARVLALGRVLARLDRFALLRFVAPTNAIEADAGFAIRAGDGRLLTLHAALAEAIAALPLGPLVAWKLRLPGVRTAIDALFGSWLARAPRRFVRPAAEVEREPRESGFDRARRRASGVVRELLVAAMLAAAINQALVELWSTKTRWANVVSSINHTGPLEAAHVQVPLQPEALRVLSQKLRFLQGWFMFSPNPVMDDGTIVVDAVTRDGRHIDPFSRGAPNFDLLHAKSLRYNQIWSDYFNRMHLPQNQAYRDAMVDYMRRLPERTGDPDDTLVSGDVYWISDMNPKWGERESWNEKREMLFSFGSSGGAVAPTSPAVAAL